MLCAVMMAQAQINEGLHWYNGQITFTARNIENKNVLMEAMDEGEELCQGSESESPGLSHCQRYS